MAETVRVSCAECHAIRRPQGGWRHLGTALGIVADVWVALYLAPHLALSSL